MKDALLYVVSVSFIIGIFIASSFEKLTLGFSGLLFVLTLILFIYFKFYIKSISKNYFIFLVISMCALGAARYEFFLQTSGDKILSEYTAKEIMAEGVIVSEPDEREGNIKFVVELSSLVEYNSTTTLAQKTKIILNDMPYSRLLYGDRVVVRGMLALPEGFETESGRMFNYEKYLRKEKIFYIVKRAQVTFVSRHNGSALKEILFGIKRAYIKKTDEIIPFPESGLAAGIVVAGKKSLPESVQEDFKKSGTMQVVVLSGINVTIIANAFMKVMAPFSSVVSAACGIVGIVLFTVIAGGSATIVRGSIMSVIGIMSMVVRRDYNINRAIIVAAVIMLVQNPMLLVYDPSFQLSFLSTLGLVYGSPVLKPLFMWVTEKFQLREALSTTIATQIFVTPFMLYASGDISLVSLPANLLLFLVIPLTMLVCFIACVTGFISPIIALPFSLVAFMFLRYELTVVHLFATLPHAFTTVSHFPLWAMTLAYICYGVIMVHARRCETVRKIL